MMHQRVSGAHSVLQLTVGWCAVYVFVSYRLFLLTDSLRHIIIPDKTPGSVLICNAGTLNANLSTEVDQVLHQSAMMQ